MSRMVRESQTSGLRERVYFAETCYHMLVEAIEANQPYAKQLALRGATLFHLHSAVVGMLRLAAKNYGVEEQGPQLSIEALAHAFQQSDVQAAEMNLVMQSLENQGDILGWLNQQVLAQYAAAGLARHPQPRSEDAPLALQQTRDDAVLGEADVARIHAAIARVAALLNECAHYMEEW